MPAVNRRQFIQSLAGAPAIQTRGGRRPNVLWLMTDEQRPDSLGCYGSPWARSPRLDELASSGTLFESAYTPSPVCVPARSSLLTGRMPSSTGVYHNQQRLAPGAAFLTWAFEKAGYRTASFGKKHYFVKGRQAFQTEGGQPTEDVVSPTQYLKGRNPADYEAVIYPGAQPWILAGEFPEDATKTAEALNVDLAINWLSGLGAGDRFFLRLSLNAPHTPVVAPRPFWKSMDPDSIRLPVLADEELRRKPRWESVALRDYQGAFRLTREQIRNARRAYYERVAFLDAQISRLLDFLKRRGQWKDTIIVFVSDHGTDLGDYGLFQKQTFYEQVARVPFFFAWPGMVRAGGRVKTPVSTIALLPTVLELAGLPAPSTSLARVLREGGEPASGDVISEIKLGYRKHRDDERILMVRRGRYKLVHYPDSGDPDGALYDLETDRLERRNLYSDAIYRATVAALAGGDRPHRTGQP